MHAQRLSYAGEWRMAELDLKNSYMFINPASRILQQQNATCVQKMCATCQVFTFQLKT